MIYRHMLPEVVGEQLFLGKDDGLVAVPLSIFSKKIPPPPIYIKTISVNGADMAMAQKPSFKADENSLSFSFEALAPYRFMRIHKSYLVNLEHVQSYLNRSAGEVVMSDGTELSVSQRKKAELLKLLGSWGKAGQ